MKKETLEEAIEKYAEIYRCPATNKNEYCRHDIISAINFGAKWQQEQVKNPLSNPLHHSIEDLLKEIQFGRPAETQLQIQKWIDELKNK